MGVARITASRGDIRDGFYDNKTNCRILERARQFFRMYPIASALQTQLGWMQYKLLISIDDDHKHEYYELEAVNNAWTGREMERQINSSLYERLLMSNDKDAILAFARKECIPENQIEIIKDPMVLEFLGLKCQAVYYEKLPVKNPTVGILLYAAKNDTLVKITLLEHNASILTSHYQLYLPSEESLLDEIKDVLELKEDLLC